MMESLGRIFGKFFFWGLVALLGGFCCHVSADAATVIEGLDFPSSDTLRIMLNAPSQYKVMKLDAREIMVAFNETELSGKIAHSGPAGSIIKEVRVGSQQDHVVTLILDTTADILDVKAEWRDGSKTLLVHLMSSVAVNPKVVPIKRPKFQKGKIPAVSSKSAAPDTASEKAAGVTSAAGEQAKPAPSPPTVSVSTPPIGEQTPAQNPSPSSAAGTDSKSALLSVVRPVDTAGSAAGTLPEPADTLTLEEVAVSPAVEADPDALIREMSKDTCGTSPLVMDALELCRTKAWGKALLLLKTRAAPKSTDPCQRELHYLKALAAYKMNSAKDSRIYLDAASYFQDAIAYFPDCPYTPYALLSLATIYRELGNYTEAKGYYRMIQKTYPTHPVNAEAKMELATLYMRAKKYEEAVTLLRQYLEEYPQSSRLPEVRLALGKALYETNQFAEALAVLMVSVGEAPQSIYRDPDLLVYIGNLNYQLGHTDAAREAMMKAVNLYPENETMSVLLTRIGDTLRDGDQPDRARKLYALVLEKYPGTDGAAVSAMRSAELLPTPPEKEAAYRTIISTYPDNPMAKLARVKLADFQLQAADYNGAIETLRGMMTSDLKEMKQEVNYILASSFDGLFKQLMEQGNLVSVFAAYEKDRRVIGSLDNPNLFQMIGEAFFRGRFYQPAVELFEKAYKLTSPANRPATLYYQLAVSLQELGKNEQAREMYYAFFQAVPKTEKHPGAYLRMGRLLISEKAYAEALEMLQTGELQSPSDSEKAEILYGEAEACRALGKLDKVPDLLIKTINLMASSSEVQNERLVQAHQLLGETYLKLSAFEKAVDAFSMALKFSGQSRPAPLLFKLAESNLKADKTEDAKTVFAEIVAGGDAFWAKMAQEQLHIMELEQRIKTGSSGTESKG